MLILILKVIFILSVGGMVLMMVRKIPVLSKLPPSEKKSLFIVRVWRAFKDFDQGEHLKSDYWERVKEQVITLKKPR